MRAALVLLFAVGVSSMNLSEVVTSHMNETQNPQPLYIQMIDNMMETLNDMKDMVKQRCQETGSAMPEDDSAHLDGVGPRFCHVQLTLKWNVCRKMCKSLPFTQLISCRSTNWFNYLNACIGGKDIMICSKPAVSDKVVDGMVHKTSGGEEITRIGDFKPCPEPMCFCEFGSPTTVLGENGCPSCACDKCPVSEGFLLSPDGTECYIAIRVERLTAGISWSAADNICKAEGMMLAQPADRNVPWLQKTLNKKYGGRDPEDSPYYWVGARGSGSGSYVWQQQQQQQQQGGGGQVNTNMWIPRAPFYGGSTEYCVRMTASDSAMRKFSGRPYYDKPCFQSSYPICQKY